MVSGRVQNGPGPFFPRLAKLQKNQGRGKPELLKNPYRAPSEPSKSHKFAPIHDERKYPGIRSQYHP